MRLTLVLTLFLTLRGSYCLMFRLQGLQHFCTANYDDDVAKELFFCGFDTVSDFDFNLETGMEYHSGLGSPGVADDGYQRVDWKNDKLYSLVEGHNAVGNINATSGFDVQFWMTPVNTINDIAKIAGRHITSVSLRNLLLDPYEGFLFLYVIDKSSDDVFILRSGLNGESLTLIRTVSVTRKIDPNNPMNKIVNFCIDIGERRLYVSNNNRTLYQYNYEGTLLEEFQAPYEIRTYAVLGDHLYIPDNRIITNMNVFSLSKNKSKLEIESVLKIRNPSAGYKLNFQPPFYYIRLKDPRTQRRKRDGKYLCDRTDCPEDCEVLDSGDTCLCTKDKSRARDGVSCYKCGQSRLTSLELQPTIVDGTNSETGDFPWQATLYYATTKEQFCGGTLISSRAVLTAAHCVTTDCQNCLPTVMQANNILVSFGNTMRDWNTKNNLTITRQVNQIFVHDEFAGASLNHAHDIALLLLDSEVPVSNLVMPACLDYNLNQLPPHETLDGYVAGFGFTSESGSLGSSQSLTLLYRKVRVMSFLNCFRNSNQINPSIFHRLTPDKFCTGSGSESPVQKGDSGGGLTLEYRGLHYVTGVVSVKLSKLRNQTLDQYSFGAFTNVSEHMTWLTKVLPEDNKTLSV